MEPVLGAVYEIPVWERDDEWTYDNELGERYKNVTYDVDFGTFVGKHESYNMFITKVPNQFSNEYEMLYIDNNAIIEDPDIHSNIPMFDFLVRFVNSRLFPHPVTSYYQTTYIRFSPEDIIEYISKHKYSLKRNIKNYIVKRRGTRKAGKKITNWMTALPPVYEIGFTGGPFYKRAEKSFKTSLKADKTRKNVRTNPG